MNWMFVTVKRRNCDLFRASPFEVFIHLKREENHVMYECGFNCFTFSLRVGELLYDRFWSCPLTGNLPKNN